MTTTTQPPTTASLAHRDDGPVVLEMVHPAASAAETLAVFRAFAELKKELLGDEDVQTFRERGQTKKFVKRSGWRKLAIAFAVDLRIVESEITYEDPDIHEGIVSARFVARAVSPNGRFAESSGYCSRSEKCCSKQCSKDHTHCPAINGPCDVKNHFTKPEHDIPATAETRAKNRACADLFGMGEVSAEEAESGGGSDYSESPDPNPNYQALRTYVGNLIQRAIDEKVTDDKTRGSQRTATLIGQAVTDLGIKTSTWDDAQANKIFARCAELLGFEDNNGSDSSPSDEKPKPAPVEAGPPDEEPPAE